MYVVNPSRLVPTWRQVDEGAGGAAEEDEVYADGVDQVEDVDHAVALLDEEHQVAQDEQDQPDRAELGAVDKPDEYKYNKYFRANNKYFCVSHLPWGETGSTVMMRSLSRSQMSLLPSTTSEKAMVGTSIR